MPEKGTIACALEGGRAALRRRPKPSSATAAAGPALTSPRDPRIDPKPGDKIRVGEGSLAQYATVMEVAGRIHYKMIQPNGPSMIYRTPMLCITNKAGWCRWARNAEVIHAA